VIRSALASLSRRALPALGRDPRPDEVRHSPQYREGRFRNTDRPRTSAAEAPSGATIREFLFGGERRTPSAPVPLVGAVKPAADPVMPGGLHITWYGHASALVEIDGHRVLIDPIWSDRPSPVPMVGPRRLHPVPHQLSDVGRIDAVLISHDHYDHLDLPTVRTLLRDQAAPFVVPIGVGAHLRHWNVPESRIVELDWHEHVELGALRLTATPAQHFSGRTLARDTTLWTSWAIRVGERAVFYSGDTGYCAAFAEIGERYGPFDATLIQIGAYDAAWPDIHMTPEEGVSTHLDVRGEVLIPVHWGTFNLAMHSWSDPVDRAWRESKAREITLAVPRPGERIDVDDPPEVDGWWQAYA